MYFTIVYMVCLRSMHNSERMISKMGTRASAREAVQAPSHGPLEIAIGRFDEGKYSLVARNSRVTGVCQNAD